MKKTIAIILSGLFTASCVDTVLLPDDKTVEEDFWQTKGDVATMVNGAYSAMASEGVQKLILGWTARSDELLVNTALNIVDQNRLQSANLSITDGYCYWGDFYSVINNCNLVIDKSAEVMDIDPNYMEGDHLSNVAQMKALRALAYFYLIRAFRDVPLILEPYKLSSQETAVAQVAPAVVLDQIIADVEEAKLYTLSSQGIADDSQRCGYFTRDGVYALLADLYLWKASVFGDESCYDKCIECCNIIRANRKMTVAGNTGGSLFGGSAQTLDDDGFGLNSYENFYAPFANKGNDDESLFELQFTNNEIVCKYFHKHEDKASSQPEFYASPVYASISADDNHVFNHANYAKDVRGFESVYSFNGGAEEQIMVRKFVSQVGLGIVSGDLAGVSKVSDRAYKNYDQNWVVYRATDVMLMKAEALVQKGLLQVYAHSVLLDQLAAATTQIDSLELGKQLHQVIQKVAKCNVEAARQVQITSTRARTDALSEMDSTKYNVATAPYTEGDNITNFVKSQVSLFNGLVETAQNLEVEVMNERARELCFEGKRWFDMLRYNYRHTTGVDYHSLLVQQGGAYAKNSEDMLALIARKFTSGGGAGVTAKMPTEPYLYVPIWKSEMEVNPLLVQNPVYTDEGTTEKNY